jgi:hypothetical protein
LVHARWRAILVALCRAIFSLASRHDFEPIGRQRPLQLQRLFRFGRQPGVAFLGRGQYHRHRLGVDRPDHIIGLGRQERKQQMLARLLFSLTGPRAPDPGEGKQRPALVEGEPMRDLGLAVGVFAE